MLFSFSKLKKKNILVYDKHSIQYAKILFKNDFEIFYNRYELINLRILIKTLIKFNYKDNNVNIKNFKNLYKFLYFSEVNPKIVYTAIDNNPGFYKLKSIFPNATYISDQNGIRDEKFYNYCANHYKSFGKKLECDFFFLFGSNYLNKISNFLNAKKIIAGKTINNHYPDTKNVIFKKTILYISSGFKYDHFKNDVSVLKNLIKFCKKYNYKLYILSRPSSKIKEAFSKCFKNEELLFIETNNLKDSYEYIQKFEIITFHHSTLGFEALSRSIKCASFGYNYFNDLAHDGPNGSFWAINKYTNVEKLLLNLIKMPKREWKKIATNYSNKILAFDLNNKKKYKVINSILKR